ncbi:DUF305 domain-containing protein [Bosea vaviloviae]|uniref:DUF305 domain-containing protein n=1 Tax=Bosea vaviloviae TaxID=1526658 RepID=A0A1D7U4K1_9HYPH|nr:DUF305 domain-containing protein [Bosea vaviloviae]AOO82262.1 DUF305 domain-containing protein [Bosea vaviloviae]
MEHGSDHKDQNHYGRLAIELTLDFIVMYLVMYTMIATLRHFHFNLNNVYMTLMMVAPMTIIMLVSMRSMFPSQRLNMIIGASALVIFLASFVAMRTQAGVGNADFLRSMIPHHSGAILMCNQASITDPEITALCRGIVTSQEKEIAQMKAILARY